MRATTELIAEEGLAGATVLRIAERAGVSWGGVQHQFGDKAAILDAVLEHVLTAFGAGVAKFSTRATSLRGRVEAWVEAAWSLQCDPTYQAFREVMRGAPAGRSGLEARALLGRVEDTLKPLRTQLFPECAKLPGTLELANLVLFATLSGMAEQQRYGLVRAATTRDQLAVLEQSLLSILADAKGR